MSGCVIPLLAKNVCEIFERKIEFIVCCSLLKATATCIIAHFCIQLPLLTCCLPRDCFILFPLKIQEHCSCLLMISSIILIPFDAAVSEPDVIFAGENQES